MISNTMIGRVLVLCLCLVFTGLVHGGKNIAERARAEIDKRAAKLAHAHTNIYARNASDYRYYNNKTAGKSFLIFATISLIQKQSTLLNRFPTSTMTWAKSTVEAFRSISMIRPGPCSTFSSPRLVSLSMKSQYGSMEDLDVALLKGSSRKMEGSSGAGACIQQSRIPTRG